jgi:hypothetical protein
VGNKKNKCKSAANKEALTSTFWGGHKKKQAKMLHPYCNIFHMKVISFIVSWIRHNYKVFDGLKISRRF